MTTNLSSIPFLPANHDEWVAMCKRAQEAETELEAYNLSAIRFAQIVETRVELYRCRALALLQQLDKWRTRFDSTCVHNEQLNATVDGMVRDLERWPKKYAAMMDTYTARYERAGAERDEVLALARTQTDTIERLTTDLDEAGLIVEQARVLLTEAWAAIDHNQYEHLAGRIGDLMNFLNQESDMPEQAPTEPTHDSP